MLLSYGASSFLPRSNSNASATLERRRGHHDSRVGVRRIRLVHSNPHLRCPTSGNQPSPPVRQVGDTAGAIQHYELADTHCVEVPRMLFERDRVEDLEDYITQVNTLIVAFYMVNRLTSAPTLVHLTHVPIS